MNLHVPQSLTARRRVRAAHGRRAELHRRAEQPAGHGHRAGLAPGPAQADAARHARRPRARLPHAARAGAPAERATAAARRVVRGAGSARERRGRRAALVDGQAALLRAPARDGLYVEPARRPRRRATAPFDDDAALPVVVRDGALLCGVLRKAHVGTGAGGIVDVLCRDLGGVACMRFMGDAQRITHEFLLQRGHHVSIEDVMLSAQGHERVNERLRQGHAALRGDPARGGDGAPADDASKGRGRHPAPALQDAAADGRHRQRAHGRAQRHPPHGDRRLQGLLHQPVADLRRPRAAVARGRAHRRREGRAHAAVLRAPRPRRSPRAAWSSTRLRSACRPPSSSTTASAGARGSSTRRSRRRRRATCSGA